MAETTQPDFLVTRPQFAVDTLRPGTAIRVTTQKWTPVNGSYAWNAIITKAEPLKIQVWRHIEREPYDRDEYSESQVTIDISHVTTKQVTIEILRHA